MKRPFTFDVDGVLLDWSSAFINFACKEKGFELDASSPCDTYDMSSWFKNMTSEVFFGLVKEFNASEFSDNIKPFDDVLTTLAHFKALGHPMVALTCYGDTEEMRANRAAQLAKHFPDIFDAITILPLRASKQEALQELDPEFFVEDYQKYTQQAHEIGIENVYIIDKTYNKSDILSIRVDSLSEVLYNYTQQLSD